MHYLPTTTFKNHNTKNKLETCYNDIQQEEEMEREEMKQCVDYFTIHMHFGRIDIIEVHLISDQLHFLSTIGSKSNDTIHLTI